jgi:hypothetical protein
LRQAQLVEEGRERQLALHPVEGGDPGDGERQAAQARLAGVADSYTIIPRPA